MFANTFKGEPLDCAGGVVNDLAADARGGVYITISGAVGSGLFYADPKGVVSQYGQGITFANGVILSPDEKTLYVTNGAVVLAFDVKADGSLLNQREFIFQLPTNLRWHFPITILRPGKGLLAQK